MKYLSLSLFFSIICLFSCTSEKKDSKRLWTEEERAVLVSGLQKSLNEALSNVNDVGDSHWVWKDNLDQWSFAEVVEHLILQDQAYYREIKVVSSLYKSSNSRTVFVKIPR